MAKSTSTSLWRPGNLLAATGIWLLKAFARLSMPTLQRIGAWVGTCVYVLFPYRRHVALTNLRLCFPDLEEDQLRVLMKQHYKSMGTGIFELAAAWYKSDEELRAQSEIVGLEHLDAATANGRGVLVVTAHFTTLEIIGRIFLIHRHLSCTYRRPDQPVIAREMDSRRGSRMRTMIHMDEARSLIRSLRSGEMVWYTPDQGKRMKYSEVLPFFGEPAVTNTATGRIARTGRAAIVPFMGQRLPDGHYRIQIFPELKDPASTDPAELARQLNSIFEDMIRKAPEQYFWLHKRFKRRGPEYPEVYDRKSGRK